MYCSNCGSEIGEGGRFCPHCGTKVDAGQEDKTSEKGKAGTAAWLEQQSLGRGSLIGALIALTATVILAAVVLFIFPGVLRKGSPDENREPIETSGRTTQSSLGAETSSSATGNGVQSSEEAGDASEPEENAEPKTVTLLTRDISYNADGSI